jgi:hypothetical protein
MRLLLCGRQQTAPHISAPPACCNSAVSVPPSAPPLQSHPPHIPQACSTSADWQQQACCSTTKLHLTRNDSAQRLSQAAAAAAGERVQVAWGVAGVICVLLSACDTRNGKLAEDTPSIYCQQMSMMLAIHGVPHSTPHGGVAVQPVTVKVPPESGGLFWQSG